MSVVNMMYSPSGLITIFNPSESTSCAFTAISTILWDSVQDMAHKDVLDSDVGYHGVDHTLAHWDL
ncbi:hypothetical protein BS47DRAFT_1355065, partial [Hydnum rufescens UP504]